MAWISGLAGKAENILNKLDQNAATALSQAPANEEAATELRKSMSSGALSLRALSPAKSSKSMSGAIGGTISINTSDLQPTPPNPIIRTATSSRRSSFESGVITINVDPAENANITNEANTALSLPQLQELAAFKIALAEVTAERNELRSRLLSLENEEPNSQMWSRLQELENHLLILNDEREMLQQENLKLQTANSAYVHSISELETNLAKLQQEFLDTAQKLQNAMKQTEQQRQDFQEYRLKAQNTLQMKDNLIAELKASKSNSGIIADNNQNTQEIDDAQHFLQLENDAVRDELKNAQAERQSLQTQLEVCRQQWQHESVENSKQLNELRELEAALRKELRMERERKLNIESEQRLTAQELYTLRHQYNQHLADAKALIREKEQQLEQLKKAKLAAQPTTDMELTTTTTTAPTTDAEIRLRALTQALVDKQNNVEHITAERNALRIQLEKLQEQHTKLVNKSKQLQSNERSARNSLLSNSTDDAKAQYPLLMTPNPFDNRVARRVKRAYSSLDSVGVRLGTFLRRYPLMRVFVLMYVALLHIWVMFVLLSSTPN